MLRIGKFEWKIILALLVTAALPLLFTVFIVDRLVEESMAVGLNAQVISGLRSGVELNKEVIESRLKIVRLQSQAIAQEPAFLRAVLEGDDPALRERLAELVASNPSIHRARVLDGEDVLAEEASALERKKSEWKAKTVRFELPGGHALEITEVISKGFLKASRQLRELSETLEKVRDNFHPWKLAYYKVFLFIYTWILVAAVVFGVLLSRSVTRRVAQLVRATRRAAQGDLAARVPASGKDEIGSLAESFNLMMDEIQRGRDRIVYLEKVSSWQDIARRLAHEIKNPLTPIQLAVQELHRSYRGEDPIFLEKLKASAEIVEEEVATLRRLVETFSEFAKLPDVQAVPMELNAFVTEFLKHNPQLADRVSFEPGPAVQVRLDRTLMKRVVMNLVNNAFEASAPEDRIRLEVHREEGWGSLWVIDQGCGLLPEARERLFHPYFTTKPTGTGLGLAIVKKIVLQHGGEITLADGRPRGTIFKVGLRVDEPTQQTG